MNSALGEKMKLLRDQLGMTQQQVAEAVGVTSGEYISMREAGRRMPSLSVLEKLAALFGRDVSYFLSEDKPVFTMLLRAEGLRLKEKTELQRFDQLCRNYAFVEELVEAAPPLAPAYDAPPSIRVKTYKGMQRYAEELADTERKRLGLGDEPIKDIFMLLERQGIHPVRLQLGKDSKLAGALVYNSAMGAFVLVNGSDSRDRQAFTAAHEYCHFLKDRQEGLTLDQVGMVGDGADDDRPPKEKIADLFAANFLMPATAVQRQIGDRRRIGPEEALYLKMYFGVSYQAMVIRLLSLGWIGKDESRALRQMSPRALETRFLGAPREDDAEPEKIPPRLLRLAIQAYTDEKITLSRLSELLDSTPPEMRRLLAESGLSKSSGEERAKGPR